MHPSSSSTSSSKRFLLRIVVPYLAVMAVVCVVIDSVITRYGALSDDTLGSTRIHRLVTTDDQNEIPILGSSRAVSNYDPDVIGEHAYNYGISGAGFDAVAFQLEEVLSRPGSKPVIVNTDLGWWSMFGVGDLAVYVPSVKDPDVRRLMGDSFRLYHYVPLARYFGLYQNYLSEWLSGLGRRKHQDENYSPELIARKLDAMRSWYVSHEPDSTRLAYLLDLVDRHPERSIVFAVAPYHPTYFEVATYSDSSETWLRELDARPHVTVVDFSRRVYSDSLFFDPVHMNPRGARTFSQDLRATIDSVLAL